MIFRLVHRIRVAYLKKNNQIREVSAIDPLQGYNFDDLYKAEKAVCESICANVKMYYDSGWEALHTQHELKDLALSMMDLTFVYEGKWYSVGEALCEIREILEEHIDYLQKVINKEWDKAGTPRKDEVKWALRLFEKVSEYIWLEFMWV